MTDMEHTVASATTLDLSNSRLSLLGVLGGVFYILIGLPLAFFLGRYTLAGAPGPFWVSVLGVAILSWTFGVGGWMVRTGLRGPSGSAATWLRRASAFAVTTLIWAPLEIVGLGDGSFQWALFPASFFVTDYVLARWVGGGASQLKPDSSSRGIEAR